MLITRQSGATTRNDGVRQQDFTGSNLDWLRQLPASLNAPGSVILLGGVSVLDFRIRVAQSHLRQDLLPSFWSHVGVLVAGEAFYTVPHDERLAPSRVPADNAIRECPIEAYADPERYPNIALLRFVGPQNDIVGNVRTLQRQRGVVDLPQLLVAWLAYAWGAGTTSNPLAENIGMPAAAMVEAAFGMDGIELTPGVASATSCPEGIWQSAVWWHEYYDKTRDAHVEAAPVTEGDERQVPDVVRPIGVYVTRQPAAAVRE